MTLHRHHKIPKHMGGTDDLSNIELLTVEEHTEAHRLLWLKYGKKADFMAWQMLSGKTSEKEALFIEVTKEYMKGNNHGSRIWSEEQKKAQSERMRGKNKGRRLGPRPLEVREKISRGLEKMHATSPQCRRRDDKGRFV